LRLIFGSSSQAAAAQASRPQDETVDVTLAHEAVGQGTDRLVDMDVAQEPIDLQGA